MGNTCALPHVFVPARGVFRASSFRHECFLSLAGVKRLSGEAQYWKMYQEAGDLWCRVSLPHLPEDLPVLQNSRRDAKRGGSLGLFFPVEESATPDRTSSREDLGLRGIGSRKMQNAGGRVGYDAFP